MAPLALREIDITIPEGFFADAGWNRIFPPEGSVLDLTFLRTALSPTTGFERFLPPRIYIREEMEQAAKEISANGNIALTVFSGSPGIGKSVVCFLLSLFKVLRRQVDAAVFLRHVEDTGESTSAFVMTLNENGSIKVRFSRDIEFDMITRNLDSTFIELKSHIQGLAEDKSFIVVDGPKASDYHNLKKLNLGCTSGGGLRLKSSFAGETFNVVMGAWRKETLEAAVVALLKNEGTQIRSDTGEIDFSSIFERVFFYRGGRIRYFYSTFKKLLENAAAEVDTRLEDNTVTTVSGQAAKLALSVSDCRSDDSHVDNLRSIFRMQGGKPDEVDMHVDSRYMMRGLQKKIEGEELFESYKKAERQNNSGAMANYFEELMHWCLSQTDELSPWVVDSIRSAGGTGTEGLAEFTRRNVYWVPSVPNFANIDSAIVDSEGALWWFQFTKGKRHTYKSRRFKSQFLPGLPAQLNCNKEAATIFYVVPNVVVFQVPAGFFSDAEAQVCYINCDSLASVCRDAKALVTANVAPIAMAP